MVAGPRMVAASPLVQEQYLEWRQLTLPSTESSIARVARSGSRGHQKIPPIQELLFRKLTREFMGRILERAKIRAGTEHMQEEHLRGALEELAAGDGQLYAKFLEHYTHQN